MYEIYLSVFLLGIWYLLYEAKVILYSPKLGLMISLVPADVFATVGAMLYLIWLFFYDYRRIQPHKPVDPLVTLVERYFINQ